MAAAITAEEIKAIRTRYGLSQRSFAQLLGIGMASIVRYEQGATPSKANANLIRAARNPQFMQECLEADGDLIPKTQRIRAESVIYDYISLDPEEDARMHEGLDVSGLSSTMSMDEMYHYTLQQEILNEQAANLISDAISRKLSFGDDDGFLSSLIRKLSLIKASIIQEDMLDDSRLAEVRGSLALAAEIIAGQGMREAS